MSWVKMAGQTFHQQNLLLFCQFSCAKLAYKSRGMDLWVSISGVPWLSELLRKCLLVCLEGPALLAEVEIESLRPKVLPNADPAAKIKILDS